MHRRATAIAVLISASASFAGVSYPLPPIPDGMKRAESEFYLVFHDLTDIEAAEAMTRMDAMVREYRNRTRDFAGRIQGKMPFLLFRREADYIAAGAPEGTAGVYNGRALMAVAGKKLDLSTWHTVQHEGFHQFAQLVIGGNLPIWVNEGMAEYFGEGIYTGDSFVTGGIPAYRVKRIVESIKEKKFKPIDQMMDFSHADWNREMKGENYDQAWAMVQFLAHADNGRYQRAFTQFMILLSKNHPWKKAWNDTFGSAEGFEKQWEAWWTSLPANPTPMVYTEANVRMLANYTARAASQKQYFATVDELVAALKGKTLKSAPADALPPGLAEDCLSLTEGVKKMGVTLSFEFPAKGATTVPLAVVAKLADGTTIRATTPTRGPRAGQIQVSTQVPKTPTTKKAGLGSKKPE